MDPIDQLRYEKLLAAGIDTNADTIQAYPALFKRAYVENRGTIPSDTDAPSNEMQIRAMMDVGMTPEQYDRMSIEAIESGELGAINRFLEIYPNMVREPITPEEMLARKRKV